MSDHDLADPRPLGRSVAPAPRHFDRGELDDGPPIGRRHMHVGRVVLARVEVEPVRTDPQQEKRPVIVRYPRDPSLDPQLVWKGKDEQDAADLEVPAVPS